jgi:cell division control protein 6
LDLLRISAELAERDDCEIVTVKYVNKAQNIMEIDQVRSIVSTLPIQYKATLAGVVLNQGKRKDGHQTTGEVYSTYIQICKHFSLDHLSQRRVGHIISELDMQGMINAKIVSLGRQGRTKFISMAIDQNQIDELFAEDAFLSDISIELTKSGNYISSTQLRLI